jgi:hypothetical protein
MCMMGLKCVISNSSPPRATASAMVLFAMRSENAALSGTTGGPHTTSTQARSGAGAGAGSGAVAGAVVGTSNGGGAAICGVTKGGPEMRDSGVRYAADKAGHQVGSSTSSQLKICSKSGATKRMGGDSI